VEVVVHQIRLRQAALSTLFQRLISSYFHVIYLFDNFDLYDLINYRKLRYLVCI
jgi:hypothetical protein